MVQIKQIYKCNICGNIIEVLHAGADELVCCGQPMELQNPKTEDEGQEKHVPVVESSNRDDKSVKIKIGSEEHPMTPEHHIEWIEVITPDKVLRKFLNPDEKPEKEFTVRGSKFTARTYCNIHGLWQSAE